MFVALLIGVAAFVAITPGSGDAEPVAGHAGAHMARRSSDWAAQLGRRRSGGMRIGKMPGERREPLSSGSIGSGGDGASVERSVRSAPVVSPDAADGLIIRRGVTAAGGITIELDGRFMTQVGMDSSSPSGAECTVGSSESGRE